MSFSQTPTQFCGFSFPNQNSYSAPIQSPPGQNMQTVSSMGGHKMGSQHLDWVQALIYDVKSIQSQVSKIDNIEKAMNKMCTRIHDLEVNVGGHNYTS